MVYIFGFKEVQAIAFDTIEGSTSKILCTITSSKTIGRANLEKMMLRRYSVFLFLQQFKSKWVLRE